MTYRRTVHRMMALAAMLVLSSCEALWMAAYRHQGRDPKPAKIAVPEAEAKENLKWFYEKYFDAPLTRALNTPATEHRMRTVAFEQPLLLPIKYHGSEYYQNYEDWTVTVNDHDYTVPKGLVVDGASVPRACWFFMPPDGLHRGAALFHDYGYLYRGVFPDGSRMSKAEVDFAFYNLMRAAGVSKTRAGIAYQGVHEFGWPAWNSIDTPIILPVSRNLGAPEFIKHRTILSHIFAP